ncbi:DUF1634 domain-containing protein [Paraflavitalea soli]|uniref:DUF1634 domain-containing protein n=1 Tax=Paraflavitalea soli TaxID=2315862 RepID=A0A3B7MR11_9BACT|nr:DUF1634 domain-containing protein [Paraflavitalea soli]AXY74045.1 DUF1634 domain-containing protein [Paraflavitalea soli]
MNNSKHISDKNIESIMGSLLRYGVLIAALIVAAGASIYLWQHGAGRPAYHVFEGEPKRLTQIAAIWKNAMEGRGRALIQLGILVLIATPIARVLFSVVGFVLEKDLLYTFITLFVLAVIIISLL